MRFAFTADIHLSRYLHDKLEDSTNLPERLNSIVNTLNNMISYCRQNKIQQITIGGDLLHDKSVIYAIAQSIMIELFRSNPDLIFTVIDGNHDLSGKGTKVVSALKSIDNEPNVNRIQGDYYHDQINDILYVPYSHKMVDIIKSKSAKYLISHFGLSEGILNSGISIVTNIKMRDLVGKYKYVYLGHYHLPQSIINEDIQIYYSGSLIQLDRGEKNEDKRFLIIDTDKETTESVLSSGYKKFIEYEINEENKDEIINQARQDQENGHNVSIVKRDGNLKSSDLETEFKIIDKSEKDVTNRGVDSNMTERDKIKKYLEIQNIPPEDIEEYVIEAMSIVNSCRGE